jgi:hypothetical protein
VKVKKMANLVRQFSGRKRGSSVWTYFKFEEKENKCRCLVVLRNGLSCNTMVKNEISTNSSTSASATAFWHQKQDSKVYSILPLIAQDFVSAPASQAFVERLFSVCGILTAGRRNRMDKSLNMRAWLKVNHSELADIGNGFN